MALGDLDGVPDMLPQNEAPCHIDEFKLSLKRQQKQEDHSDLPSAPLP